MKDLFSDLLQRSRGEDLPSPVVPSRFEGVSAPAHAWGEVEDFIAVRTDPRRPVAPLDSPRVDRLRVRLSPVEELGDQSHGHGQTGGAPLVPDRPALDMPPEAPGPVAQTAPPLDLQAIIAAALRQRDVTTDADAAPRTRPDPGPAPATDDGRAPAMPQDHPSIAAAGMVPPSPPRTSAAEPVPPSGPPAVEVRIGRIEITAAPAPPPRPAPVSRAPRPATVGLSLREYLTRRQRR